SLTQAIGIVFGANIGTTITGWIISIKIGKYGLLFIGLGIFPMLFGKTNRFRQIGRILFGIGMIFFGLELMSGAFKPLRKMPEFLDAISYFSEQNYGAYIASIFVGCLLTIIIQSSSAMLGITMALAMSGVIQFHTAAALVLGENIGTTITALLASVGGSIEAKRTARAHATFNLLGVFVIFAIFPFYVEFIDWVVPGNPNVPNAKGEFDSIGVHIATGHSIFNISAALFFLPWVNTLAKFVTKITPDSGKKEQHHLVMLGDPYTVIPSAALIEARNELNKMRDVVGRAFSLAEKLFKGEIDKKDREETIEKIHSYEEACDNIQKEITIFVLKLTERPLSGKESAEAHALTKISDELEFISDYLYSLSKYTKRIPIEVLLDKEAGADFFSLFQEVQAFFFKVGDSIEKNEIIDPAEIRKITEGIKKTSNQIRGRYLERVGSGKYAPMTALTYSDIIVSLRKIRSHIEHMAEEHLEFLGSEDS
ncbi:MAG: Na/Pi cotransporter family protein, partial [Halobacteriovoraceae bacterium]|nr:Na/Pi cotransporter family protein [Halobacteriovoraceae bacterium]